MGLPQAASGGRGEDGWIREEDTQPEPQTRVVLCAREQKTFKVEGKK